MGNEDSKIQEDKVKDIGNVSDGESSPFFKSVDVNWDLRKSKPNVRTKCVKLQVGEVVSFENKNGFFMGTQLGMFDVRMKDVKSERFCNGTYRVRKPLFRPAKLSDGYYSFESIEEPEYFLHCVHGRGCSLARVRDEEFFCRNCTWKIGFDDAKPEEKTITPLTYPTMYFCPNNEYSGSTISVREKPEKIDEKFERTRHWYILRDEKVEKVCLKNEKRENSKEKPVNFSEHPLTEGEVVIFELADRRNIVLAYDKKSPYQVSALDPLRRSNIRRCSSTLEYRFIVRKGLSKAENYDGYSFESPDHPGYFMRHRNHWIWVEKNNDTPLFENDATWTRNLFGNLCKKISSVNYPYDFLMAFMEQPKPDPDEYYGMHDFLECEEEEEEEEEDGEGPGSGRVRIHAKPSFEGIVGENIWVIRRCPSLMILDRKERVEFLQEIVEEESDFKIRLDNNIFDVFRFLMM